MKNSYYVLILFLFIFLSFSLTLKYFDLKLVRAQGYQPITQPTSANVTISGFIGDIIVLHNPVNFTDPLAAEGIRPAQNYPKFNADGVGYITVRTTSASNVNWQIFINASDLTDGIRTIPISRITINSTCNGSIPSPSLITLSNNLQAVCTGVNSIPKQNSADIYFYLYVPEGQYNSTYRGHLWIFLNSTEAYNNRTWTGLNNITVTIRRYIEWAWRNTPISFGSMVPADPYAYKNATCQPVLGPGCGWPANASIGVATNIFIDFYINGTDLTEQIDPNLKILANNITYSNATQIDASGNPINWNNFHVLNYNRPSNPIPDFANWRMVPNRTNILSWWNISIIAGQPGGTYVGNVIGRAYDVGQNPSTT